MYIQYIARYKLRKYLNSVNNDLSSNNFMKSKILIVSIAFFTLAHCQEYSSNDNYQLIKELESLLDVSSGIEGTKMAGVMPRVTEIRHRTPANISWFDKTWSWKGVDFSKYRGGVVGAIFAQANKHAKTLHQKGFKLAGVDFFAIPSFPENGEPNYVGWYRNSKLKYDSLTQIDTKQDPIDRDAKQIIYRRSYAKQYGGGVLFISYRYTRANSRLNIELMYSDFNGDFETFEEHQFQEKLIAE